MPQTDDWFWSLPLSVVGWVVFAVLTGGVAAIMLYARFEQWRERRRRR
jgi:hypothetical protein